MPKAVHALLVALFAVSPVAAEAANQAAPRSRPEASPGGAAAIGECATRYDASLKRIGEENLPALKALSTAPSAPAAAGDPTLPGTPLFVSRSRPRSQDEVAALTAAVALARSRGASSAVTGQDSPWIAQRLRESLADYLGQKPTPFLCNGVKDYVRTLRTYALRLGPVADRRQEWVEAQRAGTARSVAAAFEAIRLAKPAAAGVTSTAAAPAKLAEGPQPEQPAPQTIALATPDDLIAAVDKLVAAATEAGLVALPVTPGAPPAGLDVAAHPILAKLAAEKPLVFSARPAIRSQPVRLKILGAFADIEMLDYLMEARSEVEDPLAKALDKTLDDIEAAHAKDCTCAQ